jgi:non-specific serine/threonine protein kinase
MSSMADQVGTCATCGAATATSRRRPARYCSNACRQRAYRRRANEPLTALDSFVGRDDELQRLAEFADARVLTLVGPAGVGKTRLAKEFTGGRAEWVELSSVSGGVARACATALGIGEVTREPVLSTLVHALAGRTTLLVLDNCEHVVAECAALLEPLLLGCPGIRVVATSREPLRVPGEVLFAVQPLPIPCAVALFADRARANQLGLRFDDRDVLAALCARLDRLPLAIELAARLVTVLPVEELLARLDDRLELLNRGNRTAAERHQSLRAAIEWSYDHLSADEQHVFRCLSPFPGGLGLDVAVAACDLPADRVLALLSALVAKSLLTFSGSGRFEQLESVRLYGREKLAEQSDTVLAGVARWFAGHWPRFTSTVFPEIADPLITECGNLRCAVDWAARTGDPSYLRLALMLSAAWRDQGQVSQGRSLLETAVRTAADPAERCLALCHLAHLAGTESNGGMAWAEEAVALGRELGEPTLLAQALNALAGEHVRADRDGEARKYYEEAVALLAPTADPLDLALVEHNLAWAALRSGDVEFADAVIADMPPVYRRLTPPVSRSALRGADTFPAEGRQMTREQALSERERQVVALVAAGRTNAGIGDELRISQRMVETHLQRVRRKLDLTTRTQIAAWGSARG